MIFQKIAILTPRNTWFFEYAEKLKEGLKNGNYSVKMFEKHENIDSQYEIVFILSYPRIIQKEYLDKHEHNIVVHGSDLPKGKGWSPVFWQILEGKNKIPIVLFEAVPEMDAGPIYIKKYLRYKGHELNYEIRRKIGLKVIEMCLEFLDKYSNLQATPQKGAETIYPRRTPKDSKLDINKTIKEQFNLLRIVNNDHYPAFFIKGGKKYILKIYEEKKDNQKFS